MTASPARPRTLLFYAPALLDGGAERVWARLASAFAARGDAVAFAVDFEATQSAPFLSRDVALEVLPRGHFQSTRALARLIAARRPDATLSALAVANLKHAIAATLAGRRDRAILAYHGFSESEPQLLSRIGYRLTPLLSRLCAATVAVSAALRHDLIARFVVPERRVRTIYNPAAPAPFPEPLAAGALAARPKTIVALGRLVPDKDFVTLLRAFARLDDRDARLVILGEGAERARLEAEAWGLGIAGRGRHARLRVRRCGAARRGARLRAVVAPRSVRPRLRRGARPRPAGRRHRLRRAGGNPRRAGAWHPGSGRRRRGAGARACGARSPIQAIPRRARRGRANSPSKRRATVTTR